MGTLESVINDYIEVYGSTDEKEIHALYKGNYEQIFATKNLELDESLEFGELVGSAIFQVLVFILTKVGESILKDGYDLSKEKFLNYLIKDKNKIQDDVPKHDLQITTETVEKLIKLLENTPENINEQKDIANNALNANPPQSPPA